MTRATGNDETVDPAVIDRRMREHVARTTCQQVEIAAERLDDDRREALETLCRNLTEGVLGGPLTALKVAEACVDPELARTIATLFDVEPSTETPEVADTGARESVPPVEH